ncbi:MAG: TonB-dependent receptor, partial [Sinomicrobium sp.]|nr:TonB-dependent receptor [Sinomicrobium sp.]
AYHYITGKWDFTMGVRGELADRTIFYREFTTPFNDPFLQAKNNPFNIIPSLNIKRILTDNANLRLAASVTTTRPRIREILPILYANGDFTTVAGNETLENSVNYNLDIKYEYFIAGGGVFAFTAFGKYIDKPIETVLEPIAGGRSLGFRNSKEATVAGVEAEYAMGLDKIFGAAGEWKNLRFGFNGSLMYTNTKIAEDNMFLTSNERKLQGASPWLINSDLSYSKTFNARWESVFTLAYNVYGPRIFALGANNLNDAVEKPFHQLDLIWRNEIGKKVAFGISVKNILNDTFRVTQVPSASALPEADIYAFKKGIDFSFSIGYTFD